MAAIPGHLLAAEGKPKVATRNSYSRHWLWRLRIHAIDATDAFWLHRQYFLLVSHKGKHMSVMNDLIVFLP